MYGVTEVYKYTSTQTVRQLILQYVPTQTPGSARELQNETS